MQLKIKNRNLVLATLFAFTATFFLGGYIGYKKMQKVADAKETALNNEITSYQYKQIEFNRYIRDLEQLIRNQTLLINKGEEARRDLISTNAGQRDKIKRLEKEVVSLKSSIDSIKNTPVIPLPPSSTGL